MRLPIVRVACIVMLLSAAAFTHLPAQKRQSRAGKDSLLTSGVLSGLAFRGIGPAVTSGRIVDIAVDPSNSDRFYIAAACGGVWRTSNGGTSWTPVFDGQKSFSIGCIAIDPVNPHTVWIGTGENNSQRSVSYGDGVYRSDDDGRTWRCLGLERSEHIGKILVDPTHPATVYVAAQGPLWAPGGDRGLYKTTDGGKTWIPSLTISENTGVTDVAMDPRDPNVLYAASYQRRRHVWTLIDGGPEAKIFKSTNGGASWDTLRTGLPSGDVGRIGLAVSPVNPDIVYATIELPEGKGGFYRSTDRGASWEKRSDVVTDAPQYYQEIFCDPRQPGRVYMMGTILFVTDDGGKTFRPLGNRYRHVDDHAFWIDPANPDHYRVGGDGGLYESRDRAETWRFFENLPITQFYRVTVDNTRPFSWVYGGTQDNWSLGGPSRTIASDGILNENWIVTNGGDGFVSAVDPDEPDIVYAESQYGGLVRFDRRSGERMDIQPLPAPGDPPLRWNWDSPLLISSHDHRRLYFASNILFRSDDRGGGWKAVSPDLSRQIDRNTLPVMGKVWGPDAVAKNASTSFYGTIVALSESPLRDGLLYVGTDDGLVQISEDGGATWRKIESFPGIPDRAYVSCILASRHREGTLYVSFDNHKMADFNPYVLKSTDNGRSWAPIVSGLPKNGAVYCLAEDHVSADLLFAGTEFGLYTSVDGGDAWLRLQGGLPPAAIRDIAIQRTDNDIVVATFGRGFYVLDDYTPLRSLTPDVLAQDAHLFPVRDALMYVPSTARQRAFQGETFFAAPNPPFGASITCYVKDAVKTRKERRLEAEREAAKRKETPPYPTPEELRAEDEEKAPSLILRITDSAGTVVRTLTAPAAKGLQRIAWDLRYQDQTPVRDANAPNPGSSVPVLPGVYHASLSRVVDGVETPLAGPVAIVAKPLVTATLPASDRADLAAFQRRLAALQAATLAADRTVSELKTRIGLIHGALTASAGATRQMRDARRAIEDTLDRMRRELSGDPSISRRNENQPPSILDRMNQAVYSQWSSTAAPTRENRELYEQTAALLGRLTGRIRALADGALRDLERQLDDIGAPWTPGRLPAWKDR